MAYADAYAALGCAPAAGSGNADVLRLAIAQALGWANSAVVYATGAIVGNMLAPSKTLATLPISVFVVGMAACTSPTGAIARLTSAMAELPADGKLAA